MQSQFSRRIRLLTCIVLLGMSVLLNNLMSPSVAHASSGFHGNHFYTTSVQEANYAIQYLGFVNETGYDSIYVFKQQVTDSVRLHRYYNPEAGDHFYCTEVVCKAPPPGYVEESYVDPMYVFTDSLLEHGSSPGETNFSPTLLYRFYNPTSSDHFYCTENICDSNYPPPGYVSELGYDWIFVVGGSYVRNSVVDGTPQRAVRLYRLYHP